MTQPHQRRRGAASPIGSGQTRRSLQAAHSAPLQTASKRSETRSTVSKSSVQNPNSKLRGAKAEGR
jgi:hypothetical protein